jgi:hypothetical protein
MLREDALTAEEIKLIFGSMWPKRPAKVGGEGCPSSV